MYAWLLGMVWLVGASTPSCGLGQAGEQPGSLGENCQYFELAGALAISLSSRLESGRSTPRLAVRNYGIWSQARLA